MGMRNMKRSVKRMRGSKANWPSVQRKDGHWVCDLSPFLGKHSEYVPWRETPGWRTVGGMRGPIRSEIRRLKVTGVFGDLEIWRRGLFDKMWATEAKELDKVWKVRGRPTWDGDNATFLARAGGGGRTGKASGQDVETWGGGGAVVKVEAAKVVKTDERDNGLSKLFGGLLRLGQPKPGGDADADGVEEEVPLKREKKPKKSKKPKKTAEPEAGPSGELPAPAAEAAPPLKVAKANKGKDAAAEEKQVKDDGNDKSKAKAKSKTAEKAPAAPAEVPPLDAPKKKKKKKPKSTVAA